MIRALHATFLFCLGIWVGGMVTLGLFVAPVLFQTLPSRLQAGTTFGSVLHAFGYFQIALAAACLVCLIVLLLSGGLDSRRAGVRIGAISIMLVLVLISQFHLAPEIVRERNALSGFDAIPSGTPAKARFDRLHRLSVQLAGSTLLLGAGVFAWSATSVKPADGR
jgi:hypothetical protein